MFARVGLQDLTAWVDFTAVAEAATRYDSLTVATEERARAEAHAERVAQMRERFTTGARLVLPLTNMQMEMDPNQVTPVEGLGQVYGILTVRDAWGELRTTEGGLINSDFTRLTVARPTAGGLSGPGWTLRLNPGFAVSQPNEFGVITVASVSQGE